ncbi:PREDICTED: protein FAM133B isoform X2 [Ipomoea nil]|uniref:protein FAM133B isoform X2 n=1 Tax=Ipomoea nil TaxID=35883 RepID=UPI000901E06C|nr:PREDICTED: protein FAM133B isoform X2 [Ipomoea nil]
MGTEKKKHRRSSEPSSPQRDEVKRKRHRSEEDEREGKREKKDGSRKEKKHKSHKSSKRHSDKEKSGEKHKSKSHKHKDSSLKFEELTKDDYFSKNNEFAAWLKEKKNLFFMDLSSEAAHDLFLDFVKEWNKGKLASEYYEGISTGPRSSHKWNIKQ